MKTKKIIKVLNRIKKHCKANEDCVNCPFDGLLCEYLPTDWDIETLEKQLEEMED